MLGVQPSLDTSKTVGTAANARRLLGYVLTTRSYDPGKEMIFRLEDRAAKAGFRMEHSEWDVGYASNPYRVGLWRTLRKLVCDQCDVRRMPFSLMNFEDFVEQALKPCICGNTRGFDGIVVSKLDHITSDKNKGALLVLELAAKGKHIMAEDGICLSCCHPATRKLLNRAE